MKKIEIIVERNDELLWGRVEGKNWMPTPYGVNVKEVVENLKALVADYVANEGANDKQWNNIDWDKAYVVFLYDISSFF